MQFPCHHFGGTEERSFCQRSPMISPILIGLILAFSSVPSPAPNRSNTTRAAVSRNCDHNVHAQLSKKTKSWQNLESLSNRASFSDYSDRRRKPGATDGRGNYLRLSCKKQYCSSIIFRGWRYRHASLPSFKQTHPHHTTLASCCGGRFNTQGRRAACRAGEGPLVALLFWIP